MFRSIIRECVQWSLILSCVTLSSCGSWQNFKRSTVNDADRIFELYPQTTEISDISCLNPPEAVAACHCFDAIGDLEPADEFFEGDQKDIDESYIDAKESVQNAISELQSGRLIGYNSCVTAWKAAQRVNTFQTEWKASNCSSEDPEPPRCEELDHATFEALKVPDPVRRSLLCAQNTRDRDASFLLCGEKKQLTAGLLIAGLAAGAGGAAAAGSTLGAVSLGSVAGAALGFDYITYNSPKTKAFADATMKSDCILRLTQPLGQELHDVNDRFTNLKNETDALERMGQTCSATDDVFNLEVYRAEEQIASEQSKTASTQLLNFSPAIVSAVASTQWKAFAASQDGVITPAGISQAVQAMSISLPSLKGLPAPASATSESGGGRGVSCQAELQRLESGIRNFRAALARVNFPDPQFQTCLNAGASSPPGASPSAAATPATQKQAPAANDSTANAQIPSKTAGTDTQAASTQASCMSNVLSFQALPDTLNGKNNGDGTTSLVASGSTVGISCGTPPYYWIPIGPEVTLTPSSVITSPVVTLKPGNKLGRVLIADQKGTQQLLIVKPTPTITKTPTATPTCTPQSRPG